jgi:hypothetical protein
MSQNSIKQFCKKNNKPKLIIEENNQFNDLLEPYKNSEFIPTNIINTVLSSVMPSSEIIHSYSERHIIIKVKVNDLLILPITNFKYNRSPDLTRCTDIAKYIYISKNPLDTMLYLSFNNINKTFDIIDGIHRYTSLKIIKDNNSKSLDLITPGDFGNNNDAKWLYDSHVILNIRFNAIEGEVIELFQNLNKSLPIPDLYIRDFVREKKEIIENVANNWQVKYKPHFSSNNKPNKPNINRDRFIDLLEEIYVKYKINEDNKHILEQVIDRANWNIFTNIPHKLSETIIEKCKLTGCWLFIYPVDKLIKII